MLARAWQFAALAAACVECSPRRQRYIVEFRDAAAARRAFSAQGAAAAWDGVEVAAPLTSRFHKHAVAAVMTEAQAGRLLEEDAHVEFVEPDLPRFPMRSVASQTEPAGAPYGIALVQADQVQEAVFPTKSLCIIDSGLDMTHPDFAGNPHITGSDDPDGAGSWRADEDGHGTHVAGTVFAPRNGEGVVGVNPNGFLRVHVVKVFGAEGWAYSSSLVAALGECLDAGADVVSMSLGGSGASRWEANAFREAAAGGALAFAAAGNDGSTRESFPASYDAVVSVGGVDRVEALYRGSQRNAQVELAAPGVDVVSAAAGGGVRPATGTSMACPHAAGVAALVWNRAPACSAAEVRLALRATAKDLGVAGRDDSFGHGLVQARAALTRLQERCAGATPPPKPLQTQGCGARDIVDETTEALCGFTRSFLLEVVQVELAVETPGWFCYSADLKVQVAGAAASAAVNVAHGAAAAVPVTALVPAGTPVAVRVENQNKYCDAVVTATVTFREAQ